MSKLLARAKVKFFNSQSNYIRIGQDDAFLDETCYNLQQTIELCLKYMVEMQGDEYIENHDIRAQLNKLDYVPNKEKLIQMASTINSWEAESRYNDNFTALIEEINAVREIAGKLIEHCESLVTEEND